MKRKVKTDNEPQCLELRFTPNLIKTQAFNMAGLLLQCSGLNKTTDETSTVEPWL